jgi:hypothetical protein
MTLEKFIPPDDVSALGLSDGFEQFRLFVRRKHEAFIVFTRNHRDGSAFVERGSLNNDPAVDDFSGCDSHVKRHLGLLASHVVYRPGHIARVAELRNSSSFV